MIEIPQSANCGELNREEIMIYGRIENLEREASYLPAEIVRGLRFLADTDIAALPCGEVEIEGREIFAIIQDYETLPKDACKPEAHVRYIDIQYVASGCETIFTAPLPEDAKPSEDHLADRDVAFFDAVPPETGLILDAGSYAVFFPWDIHRPKCRGGAVSKVRKVVVKIRTRN